MATNRKNRGTSKPADGVVAEQVVAVVEPGKPEISPEEKAQLKRWLDTIEQEKNLHKDLWKQIRKNRDAAAGVADTEVKVNLHQASLETLLPILYAQDPEVQVKPARSVNQARFAAVRAFSTTLEIVTQNQLAGQTGTVLKTHCERIIRSVKTAGFGVLKVTFQTDTEQDPVIVRRIADVQDNLQRIACLTEQLNEGEGYGGDEEATRKDLQDTLVALQAKVEVLKSLGVVLDIVSADDFIVPHDVSELIDYANAPWLAQRIWMRKEEAEQRFSLSSEECGTLTTYPDRDAAIDREDGNKAQPVTAGNKSGEKVELVAPWEIWDRRNNMVYTILEGLATRYAKPAFAPRFTGRRFYSYFLLGMSWVDGKREPLSAVEMADPLVQEYNRTRSGYREHRERAIPCTLVDGGTLSQADAEKIKNRERIEMLAVDGNGAPMANLVHVVSYPPVDQGLYDTSVIRGELDVLYGVQDAMRGEVQQPKTATEAGIMQQGLASRTGGQRTQLESWLTEIAQYTAEVLLLAMPKQQVMEIAGEGAQWPQLSRAQIQNDVVIEIRAGSTGKPDQQKDIQNWEQLAKTLLELLDKYAMALETGKQGLAESYKAIFAETLRRLDERLDPEQFLPKVDQQPPPPPPPQPLPETALMGPQVQALQAIVLAAQGGVLLPERATALIQAAFPHVPPPIIAQLVGEPSPMPAAAPGAPAPAGQAGGPASLPHPAIVKEALELAKRDPEVGRAVHAAVEGMRGNGAASPTPPPG